MYLRVGGSSVVRCKRAGKYEAKRDQIFCRLSQFEREASFPSVCACDVRTMKRYGSSSGQKKGIVQAQKK